MLQFILRRLGLVIPTFIGITLLTFAFVHMLPGDPVMIMAGPRRQTCLTTTSKTYRVFIVMYALGLTTTGR